MSVRGGGLLGIKGIAGFHFHKMAFLFFFFPLESFVRLCRVISSLSSSLSKYACDRSLLELLQAAQSNCRLLS